MTFEQIPIRMLQLGVDRDWLAKQCDYSLRTMAAILAPNASPANKTDKALRRIWEALDREEQRQKQAIYKPAPLTNTVTLTPTVEQFDRWMRAAYRNHDSFDEWAKAGLDAIADETLTAKKQINYLTAVEDQPTSKVAEDETPYKTKKK